MAGPSSGWPSSGCHSCAWCRCMSRIDSVGVDCFGLAGQATPDPGCHIASTWPMVSGADRVLDLIDDPLQMPGEPVRRVDGVGGCGSDPRWLPSGSSSVRCSHRRSSVGLRPRGSASGDPAVPPPSLHDDGGGGSVGAPHCDREMAIGDSGQHVRLNRSWAGMHCEDFVGFTQQVQGTCPWRRTAGPMATSAAGRRSSRCGCIRCARIGQAPVAERSPVTDASGERSSAGSPLSSSSSSCSTCSGKGRGRDRPGAGSDRLTQGAIDHRITGCDPGDVEVIVNAAARRSSSRGTSIREIDGSVGIGPPMPG